MKNASQITLFGDLPAANENQGVGVRLKSLKKKTQEIDPAPKDGFVAFNDDSEDVTRQGKANEPAQVDAGEMAQVDAGEIGQVNAGITGHISPDETKQVNADVTGLINATSEATAEKTSLAGGVETTAASGVETTAASPDETRNASNDLTIGAGDDITSKLSTDETLEEKSLADTITVDNAVTDTVHFPSDTRALKDFNESSAAVENVIEPGEFIHQPPDIEDSAIDLSSNAVNETPGITIQDNEDDTVEEVSPAIVGKSPRGRKSLKNIESGADLINIPPDEQLFKKQYYAIGEVAEMFHVNQSLIRFWETEFDIIQPRKNRKGDRHFRPVDIKNLLLIHDLLRRRKLTIEGAKDFLKKNKRSPERFAMIQSLQQIKAFILEVKATL